MKKGFDKICLDTNILIYSTFPDFESEKHKICMASLDSLTSSGSALYISSQVLREFFAVSTNPKIFKKPLTCKQATKKIKEFTDYFIMISETETTIHTLLSLLEKYPVLRHKIHDMNIVATMIDNDIYRLMTFNIADFENIKEISVVGG